MKGRKEVEKFVFVYYGGKMAPIPKEQQKSMADWNAWFASLGKAVVDAGAPTMPGKVVSSKGIKDGTIGEAVTGYSVIQADNIDAAAKLAAKCPQVTSAGGQIAVYKAMPMM